MKNLKTSLLSLFAAVGLLFGAAAVHAQDGVMPPTPEPEQIQVSDQDVSNFVDAYLAVQTINQEYTEKLQAVESAEQATELQQEAQGKMQEAVSDSGLTVQEYQQIANQANQDEELRERITSELTRQIES